MSKLSGIFQGYANAIGPHTAAPTNDPTTQKAAPPPSDGALQKWSDIFSGSAKEKVDGERNQYLGSLILPKTQLELYDEEDG